MSRTVASPYIEWAKLSSSATYSLAASGVPQVTAADVGLTMDDVEIVGPSAYGWAPLLACIARKHGVDEACVVTAAGTSMANHLALAALIDHGDEVILERPTYEPILGVLEYLGRARDARRSSASRRVLARSRRDRAGHREHTRLIVLANLHNPSSHLLPDEALARIGRAAERVGARVLVDEVYLDAVFDAPPASCVHSGRPSYRRRA